MDLVNTLWRGRTLAIKAEEPTLLMADLLSQQQRILAGKTLKDASDEQRQALSQQRQAFAEAIKRKLVAEICPEDRVAEALTIGTHSSLAGYARTFIVQSNQQSDAGLDLTAQTIKVEIEEEGRGEGLGG